MDFLTSLGIILLSGLLLGSVCSKIKLPPLLGMLIVGIVLSPYTLNLISPNILNISADLRQLALIIILTRAGLSFDLNELKKNGRSAVLLCFVPACLEIVGYVVFGTLLLNLKWNEAALLGTVMAAVSPAVVVPRMLKLKENGYGTEKGIPQMIMAGASADDVFVMILFTALFTMSDTGSSFDFGILWKTPVSILTGIASGLLIGWLLSRFFKLFHMRDTVKMIILLSVSFLFVALESWIGNRVPFSGLLAVIAMSAILFRTYKVCAQRLSVKYSKLVVYPCGGSGRFELCSKSWSGYPCGDCALSCFSVGWGLPLRCPNKAELEREGVLHGFLSAEGNGAGGNRRHPSVGGNGLWTGHPHRGRPCNFSDRSCRRIFNRSAESKAFKSKPEQSLGR